MNTPERQQIIDRLPDSAKVMFTDLVQDMEDASVIMRAAIEKQLEARSLKNDYERDLAAVTGGRPIEADPDHYGLSVGRASVSKDHPRIKKLTGLIDTAKADLQKIQEQVDARSYRWNRAGQLVGAIEKYVRSVSGEVTIAAVKDKPVPSGGGDVLDAVELCRKKILELRSDLAAINAAPITSALAKQLARQEIDALAARGEPNCFALIENRASISWPMTTIYGDNPGTALAFSLGEMLRPTGAPGFDALSFYVWHNRDAVIASIERKIDEAADDAQALSDEERRKRRTSTLANILRTERDEESLIRVGKTRGLELQRRPEADPRAVLGLASELASPT